MTFNPVQTGLKVGVRLRLGISLRSWVVVKREWMSMCVQAYIWMSPRLWFTSLRTVVDCHVHSRSVVLRSSQQLAQLAHTYTLWMCGVWPDTCSPDVGGHSAGVSSRLWTFYVSSQCPDAVPAGLLIWSNRDWPWRSGESNTELVLSVVRCDSPKKKQGHCGGKNGIDSRWSFLRRRSRASLVEN